MIPPTPDGGWDAVVIGTGMGGGTIGRALAEAGHSVLFVEQGPMGHRAARNGLSDIFVPEARVARGLWPTPVHTRVAGQAADIYAPLGAGVGGSSVFYAATLERPERHDLDTSASRPHPTGGWPVGFDAMAPYYAAAARQYQVHGTPDPLSPDPPLPLATAPARNAMEAALHKGLTRAGLHPYHAHTAIAHPEDCLRCLGTKCPRACKMDARSAGVLPALATGKATLMDRTRVTRIRAEAGAVTGIEVTRAGAHHVLAARRYILSGGALGSAHLMLASTSAHWPNGLANSSGQVGRNLMFHLNEMFALWPPRGTAETGPTKAISLRDLYHAEGQRFGTIQSMGIAASYGEIVYFLNQALARSRFAGVPGARQLTRLPAAVAARLLGTAQIFVGLLEDFPYPENRVIRAPDRPDQLSVDYTFQPELLARRRAFRKAIRRAMKGQRYMFLGPGPELNFGHPCGTARFGTDPATSVLRPDCRTHDLSNLWVVDASFMPTSMGVNPSLTIAANALRVADTITGQGRP